MLILGPILREWGGYILFNNFLRFIYRLNLKNDYFEKIDLPGDLQDISSDDKTMACSAEGENRIVLYSVKNKTKKYFDVPKKYGQFGNIIFSPNAKKIVYVGAPGSPIASFKKDNWAVFVVDIISKKQTKLIGTENNSSHFSIDRWINDEKVSIKKWKSGDEKPEIKVFSIN